MSLHIPISNQADTAMGNLEIAETFKMVFYRFGKVNLGNTVYKCF